MTQWTELREQLAREHPSEPPKPYELRGLSPVLLAQAKLDPKNSLLGNRYLTRKSGMFFIAPSGQGKSSAVMQAMVCWGSGRSCFEISPGFQLRITMIQAEDDEGDLAEQAKVIDWLGLDHNTKVLLHHNCWIETLNDKIGLGAIRDIDQILTLKPCDLLILNPYTAYLGASIMDDEANSTFLRSHLQGLLNKHACAALIVHHTPKTNFRSNTANWSLSDWIYSGAGAAVLSNWARAILAIDPLGESGVFKFIAAKRFKHIGWEHQVNYFRHDQRPDVLLWTKASAQEIASATGSATKGSIPREKVIQAVPALDGISMMRLRKTLEDKGATQRAAKIAIDLAIEDHQLKVQTCKASNAGGHVKMIFRDNGNGNNLL